MRRTKEEAEKTKQSIMLVALSLFNKNGYDNTTLEDIAKEADVTRGAIYHHFESKADLFKQIAIKNKHNLNKLVEKIIDQYHGSPKVLAEKSLMAIVERLENDHFFRDFEELKLKTKMVGDLSPVKRFIDREFMQGVERFIRYLDKWQDRGAMSQIKNKEAFALAMIAAYSGLIEVYMRYNESLPVRENLTEICSYLFSAFDDCRPVCNSIVSNEILDKN